MTAAAPADEVIGLFAAPWMRVPCALERRLVDGLVRHFAGLATTGNNASQKLSHTRMLQPGESPLLVLLG